MAALVFGHLFERYFEDGCRGGGVNILTGTEGVQHGFIAGHMSDDTQLDLRIVDREQYMPWRGNKTEAYLAPDLCTGGDIL